MSKPGENPESSRRGRTAIRFGPFELDVACRRLTRGPAAIHLTPKVFDLLHVLATEAPRVVGKRELHDRLWPDTFVSDASLVELVKELRRALDDRDPDAPVIRTAHRIGYALCLDVEAAPHGSVRPLHWLMLRDRRIALLEGANVIGRDPEAQVWIDESGVSRRHACIVVHGTHVQLEDLGSKNGTMLGNARVTRPVALIDGDRVAFGGMVVVYRRASTGMSTDTRADGTGSSSGCAPGATRER
jgi:DNA-binding winged helix-turn-helix (wHTH) protein